MDTLELSETIQRLQGGVDIRKVVSAYLHLKENGEFYFGRCPFHNDAGESLTINPKENKFYCSVCHKGGSVLHFVALAEKISLIEAVERLAKKLGVELRSTRTNFDEENIARKKRILLEVNRYAQDFYHELLTATDRGTVGRKYLESRGITSDAIEKFQLGLAPSNDNRVLMTFLSDYSFKFEQMFEAGLVKRVDRTIFDNLQNCITIPLYNQSRQVMAIVGRVLDFDKRAFYETDEIVSEYIYPTESAIFNRRQLLFGVDAARTAIVKSKSVIIVESCLDAITLSCAGVENVIATFGKFSSLEDTTILTELADEIIFCLKNGDKLNLDEETLRHILLAEAEVFVAAFPTEPTDFILEHGKEKFLRQLKILVPFDKYGFAKKIYPETTTQPTKKNVELTNPPPNAALVQRTGEHILQRLWHDIELLRYVRAILPREVFNDYHREVLEYLQICAEENKRPSIDSARIFFGEDTDEKLFESWENAKPDSELDMLAFEDAITYLSGQRHNANYQQYGVDVIRDDAQSRKKVEKLLNYFGKL